MLGNRADAEDAVQGALLAAYGQLDQFKGQAEMSTSVTAIVHNCARLQLRLGDFSLYSDFISASAPPR
jgi:DNA-directed RNA polymerase specialized sigma24 family protein